MRLKTETLKECFRFLHLCIDIQYYTSYNIVKRIGGDMFSIQGQILDFCVLSIVGEKDTYGYEITQKLMTSIDISESTLYPVLRRLLKSGYLETYDISFDGRNRRYYKITKEGREMLLYYRAKWESYIKQVNKIVGGQND